MLSGNRPYEIEYSESVVIKDLPSLPLTIRLRVKRAIEERLTTEPVKLGKPLYYNLEGHRRLRVGDYRIVYFIDTQKHKVIITAVRHRKDVYE